MARFRVQLTNRIRSALADDGMAWTPRADGAIHVYATRWAVVHLLESGRSSEAITRLSDPFYFAALIRSAPHWTTVFTIWRATSCPDPAAMYEQSAEVAARTAPQHAQLWEDCSVILDWARLAGWLPRLRVLAANTAAATNRALGATHFETLRAAVRLARAYEEAGDLAHAETELLHVVHVSTEVQGARHPYTLRRRAALARVLAKRGRVGDAVRDLREIHQTLLSSLGAHHTLTLSVGSDLAQVEDASGHAALASVLRNDALSALQTGSTVHEPKVLQARLASARSLVRNGRRSEATPILEEVHAAAQSALGSMHPISLDASMALGRQWIAVGECARGLALLDVTLENSRIFHAEYDHPKTVAVQCALARASELSGDYRAAEVRFRQAFDHFERRLGADHPDTLAAISGLARVLERLGDVDEAAGYQERALRASSSTLGSRHPATLVRLTDVIQTRLAQGDVGGAQRAMDALDGPLSNPEPSLQAMLEPIRDRARTLRARLEDAAFEAAAATGVRVKSPSGGSTVHGTAHMGGVFDAPEAQFGSATDYGGDQALAWDGDAFDGELEFNVAGHSAVCLGEVFDRRAQPEDGWLDTVFEQGQASSSRAVGLVGTTLDNKYQIESPLASGAMGKVYAARHIELGKRLVVKTMCVALQHDQEMQMRFRQEGRFAVEVAHEHVVSVVDFGVAADGSLFMVMEYLDGISLQSLLGSRKVLPAQRAVNILRQLCSALAACHDIDVIHRDVKPANVMLIRRPEEADYVKLIDFGIAKIGSARSKLTNAGFFVGTKEYASPEALGGFHATEKSDIYSVGVVAFEMLTGHPPFRAASLREFLHMHERHAIPRMSDVAPMHSVPEHIELAVRRCLAKDPADRFASIREFVMALVLAPLGGEEPERSVGAGSMVPDTAVGSVSAVEREGFGAGLCSWVMGWRLAKVVLMGVVAVDFLVSIVRHLDGSDLELHSRQVRIRERLLGLRHPWTLISVNRLGWEFVAIKRSRDARALFARCEECWSFQPGFPLLWTRFGLSICDLIETGNSRQAEAVVHELLVMFGPTHERVVTAWSRLAAASPRNTG